jgi:hypothetical protein
MVKGLNLARVEDGMGSRCRVGSTRRYVNSESQDPEKRRQMWRSPLNSIIPRSVSTSLVCQPYEYDPKNASV